MIPPRLLVLMAVAWLAWRALRGFVRYLLAGRRLPPPPGARASAQAVGPTRACIHCGMFVPLEEGWVAADDAFYCCAAHRDAHRADS